jgi:CheY-like chemotaxis protein
MQPRALIIDDEEAARYALSSRLTDIPFDVTEAAHPRQELQLAHDLRAGWAAPTPEGTPHVARP